MKTVSLAPLITESERVLGAAVKHFKLAVKAEQIVVTVQAAGRRRALGWFGGEFWQNGKPEALHEINLSAEHLKTTDIGELLLHELAHAENKTLRIKDCSGQRHNKKFKTMAEKLGLVVEDPEKGVGYGITNLGDRGSAFLEKIAFKRELFVMHRRGMGPAKAAPGSRLVKVVCHECGYTVRTTKKWLAVGVPTCPCGQLMIAEEPEEEAAEETEETEP